MADTVNTIKLAEGPTTLIMKFNNLSDATGESGVTKVDVDTFNGPNGLPCTAMLIERIMYDCKTMGVTIKANGTTPIVLSNIAGFQDMHFKPQTGGIVTTNAGTGGGDITFTTYGAAANASYDITLFMRKIGG